MCCRWFVGRMLESFRPLALESFVPDASSSYAPAAGHGLLPVRLIPPPPRVPPLGPGASGGGAWAGRRLCRGVSTVCTVVAVPCLLAPCIRAGSTQLPTSCNALALHIFTAVKAE